jgi:acyl-CoA oxidase
MNKKFIKRILLIKNQLKSASYEGNKNNAEKHSFNKENFHKIYFPYGTDIRDIIFEIFKDKEVFGEHLYLNNNISREKSMEVLDNQFYYLVKKLEEKGISFADIRETDYIKLMAIMESIYHYDMSIVTKIAAVYILYYNSLKNLGTTDVHRNYLTRLLKYKDYGLFGLTELGHGSNTKGMECTATYDALTKEFILNTPRIESYKWWIGNAYKFANMGVIFAQLYIEDKNYGLHGFVVPLRDIHNKLYNGVIIGDCGSKLGMNAIDNGYIGFKNYRIPKSSLLNKYADIDDKGNYISQVKDEKRFALQFSQLVEGRIGIVNSSQAVLLNAITIAGRYAAIRKQFGEKGNEYPILSYQSTRSRLIPALAEQLAFRFTGNELVLRWANINVYLFII